MALSHPRRWNLQPEPKLGSYDAAQLPYRTLSCEATQQSRGLDCTHYCVLARLPGRLVVQVRITAHILGSSHVLRIQYLVHASRGCGFILASFFPRICFPRVSLSKSTHSFCSVKPIPLDQPSLPCPAPQTPLVCSDCQREPRALATLDNAELS